MKKSFKKSIAVLLAVLMVVCAFPLTAFAAEKPNVNLQFGVLSVSKTDKLPLINYKTHFIICINQFQYNSC